jgi:hypothetical protein
MRRYFLVFLLALTSFLSANAQVNIKPETARWFLEQSDRVKIYEIRDSLNTTLIDNLNYKLGVKDSLISTYQEDSLTYHTYNQTQQKEIAGLERDKKKLKRNGALKTAGIIAAFLLGLLM